MGIALGSMGLTCRRSSCCLTRVRPSPVPQEPSWLFCMGRCYSPPMEFRPSPPESEQERVWQPQELALRGIRPESADVPVDWSSWYLTDEEDMGESVAQGEIIRTMLSALGVWARERGWTRVYCGGDQFFAWVPSQPLVRVSPDIYLIELDEPGTKSSPDSWQTWLPGHRPPYFAIEVVSRDRKKDYEEAPLKYALLGTREAGRLRSRCGPSRRTGRAGPPPGLSAQCRRGSLEGLCRPRSRAQPGTRCLSGGAEGRGGRATASCPGRRWPGSGAH